MVDTPYELILVDSIPNPGHKETLNNISARLRGSNVSIKYFETRTVGGGAKFREGLAVAQGEYIFFAADELLPAYDFLSDAYEIAKKWDVCSVPYLESRDPEGSTFPLMYPKYAPVMPVTFPLARRELFVELVKEMPIHWLANLHWSLLCAELGLKVVFSSRHLYYCPLIKLDAQRPSVYTPIGQDAHFTSGQQFKQAWTAERCERAYHSMISTIKSVLRDPVDGACVVVGPKNGLFLVQQTGNLPLRRDYKEINSELDIELESNSLIEKWKTTMVNDPKVAALFHTGVIPAQSLKSKSEVKVIKSPGKLTSSFVSFKGIFRSSKLQKESQSIYTRFRETPRKIKNWRLWALRRALSPYILIPCWLTLESGAKIFLGTDPVDDLILEDILGKFETLFFPKEFQRCTDQKFIIMDIGSHHGIYAAEALTRYPKADFIAVEPVAASIGFLRKNLAKNNLLSRARIVEGGLGAEDGWAYVEHSPGGSWSDKTVQAAGNGNEKVAIYSIKTALQGAMPTLVKCNAEGAEFAVFPQMFDMGLKPEFVILMVHPESGSIDDLLNLFNLNGYLIRDVGSTAKRIRLHCILEKR